MEPGGEIQMAVLNALKDHARTAESVFKALENDYPGRFRFNDVLICMRYLEANERIAAERRDGALYFGRTDG
jgi:hypothetical protein